MAVDDRFTDTIKYILQQYVKEGSQINIDFWRSHDTATENINFINERQIVTHRKENQ